MIVDHVVRFDAGLYRGGGEIQAERTAQALSELGVTVRPYESRQLEFGDLVHFFGHFEYYEDLAEHCRRLGVPYVVSPIFATPRTPQRLRVRAARQRALGQYQRRSLRLLRGAKALITLTEQEEQKLIAYFGADLPKRVAIPNGVESRFAEGAAERFYASNAIQGPFAIHVGTINRSKNQLASIRACRGVCPLVILGRVDDDEYAAVCRAEADHSVHFIGPLPHSDSGVADALAAAHVFLLPSLHEIFPLSALEATVAGCHLILSDRWGQDVWGSDARFVDPEDSYAIRSAVEAVLEADRPPPSRAKAYLGRFSWQSVANQIVTVYRDVLA